VNIKNFYLISIKKAKGLFWFVIILFFVSGCASTRIRHAVPMDLLDNAQIYGMQDIRVLSGKPNDFLISDFISLLGQEEKRRIFLF
jgi:hypothetical protein